MARLKGPIQFVGSLGNIKSVYNKRLKHYVLSTKGGASKELIMNSPAFIRTRENMKEFSGCGLFASQVRKSLVSLMHLKSGDYYPGIVKLAKSIQLTDEEHLKGMRSIEVSNLPTLLLNLNFNSYHRFDNVLHDWPLITFSNDKKTVTLRLTEFKSSYRLHWVSRFDSYRFAMVIAQLPDFYYSFSDASYVPVLPDLEQLSVTTYSEWFPNTIEPRDITMEASFAHPALQQPGTTVIVAMGIEISSILLKPTDSYTSNQGTMKIVDCFV